jgi:hypothetical protein
LYALRDLTIRFNHESSRIVITARVVIKVPSWSSSAIEMAEYGKRPDPGVSANHMDGHRAMAKKIGYGRVIHMS